MMMIVVFAFIASCAPAASAIPHLGLDLPREAVMDVNKPPFPIVNVIAEPSRSKSIHEPRSQPVVLATTLAGKKSSSVAMARMAEESERQVAVLEHLVEMTAQ